jgi:hypothetical protein
VAQIDESTEWLRQQFPVRPTGPVRTEFERKLALLESVRMPHDRTRFLHHFPRSLAGYVSGVPERIELLRQDSSTWPDALPEGPLAALAEIADEPPPPNRLHGARLKSEGSPPQLIASTESEEWRPTLLERLFADVQADLGHDAIATPASMEWAEGAEVPLPWPTPQFVGVLDHEVFAMFPLPQERPDNDAIAVRLIMNAYRSFDRRLGAQPTFAEVIDSFARQRGREELYKHGDTARWRAYTRFRDELVVIASPEFGLTYGLAANILGHYTNAERLTISQIRDLRREYLKTRKPATPRSAWARMIDTKAAR